MRRSIVKPICFAVFLSIAAVALSAEAPDSNPYEPTRDEYRTELLIVGGSSSGTAAAITAGRLGVDTVWVLRAARDMGGLSTNAINPDSDLPIRYIGGLALEYDVVARYSGGRYVGGRHNGEGYFVPFHVLFRYTRGEVDRRRSLTVLSNLYPVAVEKEDGRVASVTFGHRLDAGRKVVVRPKITIDAEIEGDVAQLAGVTMTLKREASVESDDPTRDRESYAGRIFTPLRKPKIASLLVSGGPLMEGSTQAADARPATMAWNGSVSLEDYGEGTPESPWVLKTEPPGYDPAEFAWWETGVYGVGLSDGHRRWNIDHYLSTVEGWRLDDGRHVLESMDIRDREANEKAHLAHVIRGLWHLQHTKKQYRYGLSQYDFREGLAPKYRLSDLGTTTNAGDAPLPGLIYMREGRRMVNDHVFGGKLIEDDGSGRFVQKRYWHPRAAYFNAMLVDIHGVHKESVPGSGPEGMQLLRLARFHDFGAPCIPFDVFVPRPREATGLLVSSAGAYTHQAYAAFPRMETGRIAQGHACAVAAYHALRANVPVHEVDIRRVQITNLRMNGQSLVYFDDTIPGTYWHLVDQMLGCRRVPERNDQGVFQREDRMTVAETRTYVERLFRDYTQHPAPEERLRESLAALGGDEEAAVTRAQVVHALSAVADFTLPKEKGRPINNFLVGEGDSPIFPAGKLGQSPSCSPAAPEQESSKPFADVEPDSLLARQLAAWSERGWIAPDARYAFRPDDPVPFSEFKRHAYHVLFAGVAPETVRPVDYRPWLAHDTFNRPDGPLKRLASGQPATGTGAWTIAAGNLRPASVEGTTYLLVDAGQSDVDVSVDVFLEQTANQAAAGIVLRAADERNMQRFLVQAEGPGVKVRINTLVEGQFTDEVSLVRRTHRRSFTLRLVARGDELAYSLDGRQVHRGKRERFRGATRVGLLNGGGEASRFDNLEVRTVD